MRASARIEVARRAGVDHLVDARSTPPFAIRSTPERVLVVGSSAAPVGGDDLLLEVVVGPSASARVGTAAATLVWPGPSVFADDGSGDGSDDGVSPWSSTTVQAVVGDGGRLEWWPEPMVPVVGCRHRAHTNLELGSGATARVVEEVSLGRTSEPPGRLDLELRVVRDGRVLVHHTERLGPDIPGWGSVVHLGAARHLVTMVEVGGTCEPGSSRVEVADDLSADVSLAELRVSDDVVVTLAVGPDRPTTLRSVRGDR